MASLKSFETLALPHLGAAYNLAFWIVRSREDAEDVVQEAYLRAFRAFDDLRGEDIRPWLFAIVRNVAYRAVGARNRTANVVSLNAGPFDRDNAYAPVMEIADEGMTAEQAMVNEADRALVQAALADLPAAYREVVMLREIEGLNYREIARITGTVIGTVMSRLARGRKELRDRLALLMEKDGTYDR